MTTPKAKTCVVADCQSASVSRGRCKRHYAYFVRVERTDAPCAAAECTAPRYSRGYCNRHYLRVLKYGSPDSRQIPIHDRFWAKVNKDGPLPAYAPYLGPCWLWTAALNVGYGVFGSIGKPARTMPAHRWAYEEVHGPITPGMHLDHLCRTPACVRPSHLEAVTPRTNMRRGWMADLGAPPHCPTCSCTGHE